MAGLRIGHAFVPLADVLEALALLRDMPAAAAGDEEKTQTGLYLGADEIRALKIAAAEGGTTMGELFRRALWAAGIIRQRNLD